MQPSFSDSHHRALLRPVMIWLVVAIAMIGSPVLHGQDDPFAIKPPAGQAPAEDEQPKELMGYPEIDPELPETTRLIINSVRDSNPVTVEDVARALRTMLDLGLVEESRFYLTMLNRTARTDEEKRTLVGFAGSDLLLEVQTHPDLQPDGAAFAKAAFAGANRAAFDPERIEGLVKELSNANLSIRSARFRELRRLGGPAAAAMLSVFGDDSREAEFPFIRGALRQMDDQAIEPLVGGSRANHARVQAESLRALSAFATPEAADALLRVYASPQFPESMRRMAMDSLSSRFQLATDPAAAEQAMYSRAMDFLTGASPIPEADPSARVLWRWDAKLSRLEPLNLPIETVEQIKAANRAGDLYALRPDEPKYRQLFLLTQLESSKRLLGPSNLVEYERLATALGSLDWKEINLALARAMELGLIPAACGACELLAQIGDEQALAGRYGGKSQLIEALLSGNRHLQFAAFEAITRIDPKRAYNGSSYVLAIAAYMAGGGQQNTALVGHKLTGMGQSFASTLLQTGNRGEARARSQEFFREATSNPDIQYLFISETMSFPDSIELAQQLQQDWRTRGLPIAMLVNRNDSSERMERIFRRNPNVFVFPYSLDPRLMQAQIKRMAAVANGWAVSPNDRRRHAFAAMDWLGEIASDRKTYRFYELGAHQEALTRLIYVPGFSQVAGQVLAALGTPAAQREMVNFASQNNLPLAERQPIAQAFIESVKRSGTLLTTQEIRIQYDRYNSSEYESEPQQALLGSMLDAIESRARRNHSDE